MTKHLQRVHPGHTQPTLSTEQAQSPHPCHTHFAGAPVALDAEGVPMTIYEEAPEPVLHLHEVSHTHPGSHAHTPLSPGSPRSPLRSPGPLSTPRAAPRLWSSAIPKDAFPDDDALVAPHLHNALPTANAGDGVGGFSALSSGARRTRCLMQVSCLVWVMTRVASLFSPVLPWPSMYGLCAVLVALQQCHSLLHQHNRSRLAQCKPRPVPAFLGGILAFCAS